MASIVIIEDNPANLELMSYLLTAFGHSISTAVDGDEGIELVRRLVPELIVCDVHLPKVDGYEVARILKGDARLSAIPLLAVTALAMVGDREKGMRAGFDGYLFKPIEPETFVPEVERFLRADRHGISPLPATARIEAQSMESTVFRGRVLVVDDLAVNRELMRDLLEPLGYEVTLAASVAEGYVIACNSAPDLILSDLHMPDENGFVLLRLVKTHEALATIPFIFISSTVRGEKDRDTARKLGAECFLVRPIEPEALLAELERALARSDG